MGVHMMVEGAVVSRGPVPMHPRLIVTSKSRFGYITNTLLLNNDQHSLPQYSTYHFIIFNTYTTINIIPWEITYKIP
jgi:hypothetical protein